MPRCLVLVLPLLTVVLPPALEGQSVVWRNLVSLYGDNTEFFTPYRVGETILGGQFRSFAAIKVGEQSTVHAGVFGDVRWGSTKFLDEVKPILSFRHTGKTSLGVLGTLETERRHGYLDALEVSTLELTRPIEYGLQWIERKPIWDVDVYLNWQALNTVNEREVFDYGWTLRVRPIRQVSLEHQLHGLHHGGQLFDAGVPVTNNVASGFGVTISDTLGPLGPSALRVYELRSSGNIDPSAPPERPGHGHGTWVRASVQPRHAPEVFGVWWNGKDFLSQEGDNNYNSVGANPTFYRARRRYLEFGALRRGRLDGQTTLDAEFRLHRIDHETSIAIKGTPWEYSYRLVVRAPFQFTLH
jgi:hypothetical protein